MAIQLRAPHGAGDRWARSVYLDETPRPITVYFNEMVSVGSEGAAPRLTDVDSLLFVIDSVNTTLGTNGQVWIDDLVLGGK